MAWIGLVSNFSDVVDLIIVVVGDVDRPIVLQTLQAADCPFPINLNARTKFLFIRNWRPLFSVIRKSPLF